MDGNPSWRSIAVAARVLALSALLPLLGSACVGVVSTGEPPPPPGPSPTTSQASTPSTAYPAPRLTSDAGRESLRATAAAVGLLMPVSPVDMVTYTNPVLGLSFAYPAELGEAKFSIRPGRGSGIAWSIGFSRFNALSFDGRSPDFVENGGRLFEDTVGLGTDAQGRYLWLTPGNNLVLEHVREVVQAHGRPVVVFAEQCGPEESSGQCLSALFNLDGDRLPGGIVLPWDLKRLPYDSVRAILSTILVSPPTEPVPTFEPEP